MSNEEAKTVEADDLEESLTRLDPKGRKAVIKEMRAASTDRLETARRKLAAAEKHEAELATAKLRAEEHLKQIADAHRTAQLEVVGAKAAVSAAQQSLAEWTSIGN